MGIAGTANECHNETPDAPSELEMRLANKFRRLTMTVGQGSDSAQSDADLTVRIFGNGKYIDSSRAKFFQTDKVDVDVTGMYAVKIQYWISGEKCVPYEPVSVVLTDIRLS